jgi:hypothetical protein
MRKEEQQQQLRKSDEWLSCFRSKQFATGLVGGGGKNSKTTSVGSCSRRCLVVDTVLLCAIRQTASTHSYKNPRLAIAHIVSLQPD